MKKVVIIAFLLLCSFAIANAEETPSFITIPSGTTEISEYAFAGDSSITEVVLPDGLTRIGDYAFENCTSLYTINFPATIESIGEGAFDGCNIGQVNAIIGTYANQWCIDNGLISEWAYQIAEDEAYISYYRGNATKRIEVPAFLDGYPVVSIESTNYSSVFPYPKLLEEVVLPDTIRNIGQCTFRNCEILSSINIPSSLETLGIYAFAGCIGLTELSMPESLDSIGGRCFNGCRALTHIDMPEYMSSIGGYAFAYCDLDSFVIPKGVRKIPDNTFYYAGVHGELVIPSSVSEIGTEAFFGAHPQVIKVDSLNSWLGIKYGDTSYAHPNYASNSVELYIDGELLTDLIIPDDWNYVPECTFTGIASLQSVTFPEGMKTIKLRAFNTCVNLTEVNFSGTEEQFGDWAFAHCTSLTEINLPDSFTTADWGTFYKCTALHDVILPSSLNNITNQMFEGCSALEELYIPEGVTIIKDRAFRDCTNLAALHLSESVQSAGNYAFKNCDNLTIYGKAGSGAETIASTFDIPFIEEE